MAGAMIKKLFMSSASSAIGTGTVLGVHSALAPETPSIQGSDLRQATVDESKNLMKIDMSGASSFFMIALVITRGLAGSEESDGTKTGGCQWSLGPTSTI